MVTRLFSVISGIISFRIVLHSVAMVHLEL
jgi:hypothetical protein